MLLLHRNKATRLLLITSLMVLANDIYAEEEAVEFSTDALDATDRKNIDLGRFSENNYIAPATYLLDLKINGATFDRQKVTYIVSPDDSKKTLACLTPGMVRALALKEESQHQVRTITANCLDISPIPGTSLSNHEGTLDITIPQAWMKYSDPDWVPPERWDSGIPGLLLDYSISTQVSHRLRGGGSVSNYSAYGQTGINLGGWRLRAQYQGDYSASDHRHSFSWDQIYAYLPLPMQAAKLTLGEIYSNSQVFSSLRFTGINLASDERMLPPNLQGYAPEVHGIARTNAKVTISQGGRIIYETTVPAGPFNIQDLNSAVRGKLNVRVEEQDGSSTTFEVSTATIPYLTRPGYIRYNTSVGRASEYSHKLQGPLFWSGDFSWGLSNAWSVYGGAILSGSEYNAWSLGIGRDLLVLGALSADVTQSLSKLPNESRQQGMSFRLSYAKTFDEYHSSITFAGYRFSQKRYLTQAQYLDQRYQENNWSGREKERYTITGTKTFWADNPDWQTTLYLTYTHENYWDRRGQDRYGFSASRAFRIGRIKNITTNLSLYRSVYQGRRDDSLALSVSLPFGESRWVSYDLQQQGKKSTHMASYSDNHDSNNTWRLSAGADQRGSVALDSYYRHRAAVADLNANLSYRQDSYVSFGGTATGGLTATRYGVALSGSSGTLDTARVVVDTGVAGVPLNHRQAVTNHFGLGVVSDVTSYSRVDTRIDVDDLPASVDSSHAIATTTLTEGAIGYQKFAVTSGEKMMAQLRLQNGTAPPFGAEVFNSDGVSVAMVMDGGQTWLMGIKPGERLTAQWNGKMQCALTVPQTIPHDQSQLLLPCQ